MTAVLRTCYTNIIPQNWYTYCSLIHNTFFLQTIVIYYIEIPINIYLIIIIQITSYALVKLYIE